MMAHPHTTFAPRREKPRAAAPAEQGIIFSAPMVRAILAGKKVETRRLLDRRRLRVRVLSEVKSENLFPAGFVPTGTVLPGVHRASMNDYGAVWTVDGKDPEKKMGLRPDEFRWMSPKGEVGSRLWVRETWSDTMFRTITPPARLEDGSIEGIEYRATHDCRTFEDGCPCNPDGDGKKSDWRTPIYMPRWASRIVLEITSLRVERLHDITDKGVIAEGLDVSNVGGVLRGHIVQPDGTEFLGMPRECFKIGWDHLNARRAPWEQNPWVYVYGFRRLEGAAA